MGDKKSSTIYLDIFAPAAGACFLRELQFTSTPATSTRRFLNPITHVSSSVSHLVSLHVVLSCNLPSKSLTIPLLSTSKSEICSDSLVSSPPCHASVHSCMHHPLDQALPLAWQPRACQDLYPSARNPRTLTA
jgi:hypothetical protein